MMVTPVPSIEDGDAVLPNRSDDNDNDANDSNHPMLAKLLAGQKLSKGDWHSLEQGKRNVVTLVLGESLPTTSSTDAMPRMVRLIGAMVQDMHDPEYVAASSCNSQREQDESTFIVGTMCERTPLRLIPIPHMTTWFRQQQLQEQQQQQQQQQLKPHDRDAKRPRLDTINLNQTTTVSVDAWLAYMYYDQYPTSSSPSLLTRMTVKLNQLVELIGIVEWPCMLEEGKAGARDESFGRTMDTDDVPFEQFDDHDDSLMVPTSTPCIHVLWYSNTTSLDSYCAWGLLHSLSMPLSLPPVDTTTPVMLVDAILRHSHHIPSTTEAWIMGESIWMWLMSLAEREPFRSDYIEAGTSWVPVQMPHGPTLGCASLQWIIPDEDVESAVLWRHRLVQLLEPLVPVLISVSATEMVAGSQSWQAPHVHHHSRHLAQSLWQLPTGAVVIVDCTQEMPSAVHDPASFIATVQQLVSQHVLSYTFQGGIRMNWEADYRCIVLSVPANRHLFSCTLSMVIPSNIRIPKCIDTTDPSFTNKIWEPSQAAFIRQYLVQVRAGVAMHEHTMDHTDSFSYQRCLLPPLPPPRDNVSMCRTNIALQQQLIDYVQDDFVQRRSVARSANNHSAAIVATNTTTAAQAELDLHRWMTLTRLQARGRGDRQATVDDWKQAVALDDAMQGTLLQLARSYI